MRRAFLKTSFVATVLLFLVILLCLSAVMGELFFPMRARWADSGLLFGVLVGFICLWIADRVTSHLFKLARLTDERWSVLNSRRRY